MGAYVDTALAHEFPALAREGLAYLDSPATPQTPRPVIDAITDCGVCEVAALSRYARPSRARAGNSWASAVST